MAEAARRPSKSPVARRSARAILVDDAGRLLLIRRTKPGQAPYWTTPGGGVEPEDASVEAALHRELREELGATVTVVSQVLTLRTESTTGMHVQHFFLARLTGMDLSARSGPELADPSRGSYDLEMIDLSHGGLAAVDLRPARVKDLILADLEDLRHLSGTDG